MLIDISNLDKNKTYLINEIGKGFISNIIQYLQHKIYNQIPANQLPSHTFAVAHDGVDFFIYENHAIWKGIRKYTIAEYNKNNTNELHIFEYPLDVDRLEYYVKFNPGYSVLQLSKDLETRLMGLKVPNESGMVCSEYVCACSKEFNICYDLRQPYLFITPADFEFYLKDKRVN